MKKSRSMTTAREPSMPSTAYLLFIQFPPPPPLPPPPHSAPPWCACVSCTFAVGLHSCRVPLAVAIVLRPPSPVCGTFPSPSFLTVCIIPGFRFAHHCAEFSVLSRPGHLPSCRTLGSALAAVDVAWRLPVVGHRNADSEVEEVEDLLEEWSGRTDLTKKTNQCHVTISIHPSGHRVLGFPVLPVLFVPAVRLRTQHRYIP
ncbi:hypothetical protein OH76DRAFT_301956 [Lentinus brumalis]|uniref:Uncharacterized protein n=1 Tax=Lentinus brumalis TaxID=2498619 RepID=A0A371DG97_9APHY|nr:hypothetical protein OH76DRAFT_301956 [Polyporus brumalis]